MKHTRKGQAAMEFLMTYGWAILIVVIAVAALAAFGVFTPPTTERCLQGGTSITCAGPIPAAELDTGIVQVALQNGYGYRIQITGVNSTRTACSATAGEQTFTLTSTASGFDPASIPSGQGFVLAVNCDAPLDSGRFVEKFRLTFNDLESGLENLRADIEVIANV